VTGTICERFAGITPLNFGDLTIPQINGLVSYIERHPVPLAAMVELPKPNRGGRRKRRG
jgi:hypothetical protein